jgi:hypothetical protein
MKMMKRRKQKKTPKMRSKQMNIKKIKLFHAMDKAQALKLMVLCDLQIASRQRRRGLSRMNDVVKQLRKLES